MSELSDTPARARRDRTVQTLRSVQHYAETLIADARRVLTLADESDLEHWLLSSCRSFHVGWAGACRRSDIHCRSPLAGHSEKQKLSS